jgi:hypothetical protein
MLRHGMLRLQVLSLFFNGRSYELWQDQKENPQGIQMAHSIATAHQEQQNYVTNVQSLVMFAWLLYLGPEVGHMASSGRLGFMAAMALGVESELSAGSIS